MNLYTYHDWVPEHNHEDVLRLLTLWRQHHAALGFNPVVLGPYNARKHPAFAAVNEAVSKLPTINPKGYDVACYIRWLAMATVADGLGIMTDYDLYLTPTVGDDLNPLHHLSGADMQTLRVYQNYVPCLVVGTRQTFLRWALEFSRYQPAPGCKHTSDMCILEEFAAREPESYWRASFAKCYGETGWTTAPAVHFANSCMEGNQPRWKTIPKLLKQHASHV
jgi:hypothetical protein